MRTLWALVLFSAIVIFAATVSGCAALATALPDVIAAVTDASSILDAITEFAQKYFAEHPDAEKQAVVAKAIQKSRAALNLALRASQGAQKLEQKQVDDAFADFRAAYSELLALVGPIGVKASGPRLQATPGQLVVPTPLAMDLKVHR